MIVRRPWRRATAVVAAVLVFDLALGFTSPLDLSSSDGVDHADLPSIPGNAVPAAPLADDPTTSPHTSPSSTARPVSSPVPKPGGPATAAGSPVPATPLTPGPSSPAPTDHDSVPILYYHRAEAPPPTFPTWSRDRQRTFITYDVIPTALEAQLDWLAGNGYTTILPRDLVAHWDDGMALPVRPVILTFDDGFHDWASTVLPMLEARHMVAEFYLTLDAIRTGAITWSEVVALAAAGNGIGAHDVRHVQLTRLGSGRPPASEAVMWAEVSGIRKVIAAHVGVAPDSMAYVGGGFDPTLEALVRKAGYTSARTIVRGLTQTAARRYELHVVRIGARDDVLDLVRGNLVAGLPTFVARMHGVSDLSPK